MLKINYPKTKKEKKHIFSGKKNRSFQFHKLGKWKMKLR